LYYVIHAPIGLVTRQYREYNKLQFLHSPHIRLRTNKKNWWKAKVPRNQLKLLACMDSIRLIIAFLLL